MGQLESAMSVGLYRTIPTYFSLFRLMNIFSTVASLRLGEQAFFFGEVLIRLAVETQEVLILPPLNQIQTARILPRKRPMNQIRERERGSFRRWCRQDGSRWMPRQMPRHC